MVISNSGVLLRFAPKRVGCVQFFFMCPHKLDLFLNAMLNAIHIRTNSN